MSDTLLKWAGKRLFGKVWASALGAFCIATLAVLGEARLAQAQTSGQIEVAKERAIELIGERGPLLIDSIHTRYSQVQAGRLVWLALVLIILLPLIGFVGTLLYPKIKGKTINQRLPGVPVGRLNQLYFVQAVVIGVVLLALGFFLWLIQLWTGSLGTVTNPQIALQEQAITYIVENRRALVENYTEIFVGVAEELGADPEQVLLTTIIDNGQKFREDPLLNMTSRIINFSWPLFSNFYMIIFMGVLIFFLRRIWPDIKNMLRYPIEVLAAEREGRPVPIFEGARPVKKGQPAPYPAQPPVQAPYNNFQPGRPGPQPPYNQPPGQPGQPYNARPNPQAPYGQPGQPYNAGPNRQQPYPGNQPLPPRPVGPYQQPVNQPPAYVGQPAPQPGPGYRGPQGAQPKPGFGFPAQQVPNYQPNQAPYGRPPQGQDAAVSVMWSYARRIIWTEVKVLMAFAVLALVLAVVMGVFLALFFGTIISLLVDLTSVAMIYFIRLDGSSLIITGSTLLVLIFLAECMLLFIGAFVFLIGKLLDALRFAFTGLLTWKQSGHLIWRNFVRFAWVVFIATVLGAGLSWLATNIVVFFISADNPNWFLCLVSAPLILLVGLNLGMWLLRGFKTLKKLFRNTESYEILAAAAGNY